MQLESDFSNLLSVAGNSRSYDTQIKALNMQLDRSTPGSEASQEIVFKINNLKTTRDLEIAEAQNDEESIFNLKAKSAWSKYKQNPTAENLQAFKTIRNQQNEFLTGRGIPFEQQAEEIKIAMQGVDPNSDEYAMLEESLKKLRLLNEAGIEVSMPEYDAAQRLINTNSELLAMGNPILTDKEYLNAKKLLDSGNITLKQLKQEYPSSYAAYEKAYMLLANNRKQAWQELINQAPNDRGLIAYGNANGYITQPSTTATPADDITTTVPSDVTDITPSTTDTAVSTLDEQTQDAIPTNVPVDTTDADAVIEDEIPQRFTYDFSEGDEEELVTVNPVEMPVKDPSGGLKINEAGEVITKTRLPTVEEVKQFRAEYGDPNKSNGYTVFLSKVKQLMKNEQDTDGFISTEFNDAITEARKYGYPEEFLEKVRSEAVRLDRINRTLKNKKYIPFYPDEVLEGE